MQAGDVQVTSADTKELSDWVAFRPRTDILEGVQNFVDWYLDYYQSD